MSKMLAIFLCGFAVYFLARKRPEEKMAEYYETQGQQGAAARGMMRVLGHKL